jgi:hypothetical protein
MVYRVPHRVSQKALIRGPGGMPLPLITPRYLAGTRVSEALIGKIVVSTTYEFAGSAVSTADAQVYTFSGHALGTAGAKKIVVSTSTQGGGTGNEDVSGITVDGQACTLIRHQQYATGDGTVEMWYTDAVTAATGDVVVTWDTARDRNGVGVHALFGAAAGAAHASFGNHSTTAATGTIDCPAGGVIIGGCHAEDAGATFTWAGISERYDQVQEGSHYQGGGADEFVDEQSSLTVTSTLDSAPGKVNLVVASFGPA